MKKKLLELRQNLTKKVEEAKKLIEDGKVEEARAVTAEAEEIKTKISSMEKLEALEEEITDVEDLEPVEKEEKKPEARSILVKALRGKRLTAEERAVLKEGEASSPDISGAYIVPEDVKTEINEYKREYKSMKEFVDVQPTTTNSGSFVFEKTSTLTELEDLTEGGNIPEQLPDFDKKDYKIKDKGALLPITNQLLSDETGGLLKYIGKWFSRKAVKTENKDIFKALKEGKSATPVTSIDDIKERINLDLDPELLDGALVVTNQSGFNFLDKQKDNNGRPLLQPDPTDKTKKMLAGIRIEQFSNANLTNISTTTFPVLIGNFVEAIKFMDREQYELATSKEAGFTKNITYLRAIERYDAVLKDADAYLNLTIDSTAVQPTTVEDENPEEQPEG